MRIKSIYSLKEIAGDFMVIATGASLVDLTGSFTLNETAALLWRTLENGAEKEDLVKALTAEYDVSEQEAAEDAEAFLTFLKQKDMLE